MSEEPSTEEQLMNALISKMETMDNDIKAVQRQNQELKKMLNNPTAILRKSGFVRVDTPFSEDVEVDPFRNDEAIIKSDNSDLNNFTNEEIHEMSWEDIHEMAENVKPPLELY